MWKHAKSPLRFADLSDESLRRGPFQTVGIAQRSTTTSSVAIGIIANPASGKDVRRLIGSASVIDNNEKVNVVRRILGGLDALGIENVCYMPEHFDIVGRAIDGLHLSITATPIDMPYAGRPGDTVRATQHMLAAGVRCIVVLGGDGTSRLVGGACADTPIVAVSTGTNNALPSWIDGTVAGLAAGLIARGEVDLDQCAPPSKRLEISIEAPNLPAPIHDIALVDLAISRERFVAARAIWEPGHLADLFLTRAEPGAIGLSAIGAHLDPLGREEANGMWLRLGPSNLTVQAPIVPGIIRSVPIVSFRRIAIGEPIHFHPEPGVVAFDGEKEHEIPPNARATVTVTMNGPRLVDIRRAIDNAARSGRFRSHALEKP